MKLTIEKCSPEIESQAIKIIADALTDDPGSVFFSPEDEKRSRHTHRMVKSISKILEEFGHKYVLKKDNEIIAVTMWIPPGKQISILALIRAGFLLIPFFTGLTVFNQIMKFLDFTSRLQEQHMKSHEHWHLFYLVVHPSYQRKGYGKFILSDILKQADRDQKPVFLETFTENGVKFFKKNGFTLVSKTIFSENCIMRCMVRDPRKVSVKKIKKPSVKKAPKDKMTSR